MSSSKKEDLHVNMTGQAAADATPTGGLMKAGYLYKRGIKTVKY